MASAAPAAERAATANGSHGLLACPRCRRPLVTTATGQQRCDACALDFPDLDGVPALFSDPEAALGQWRARLHAELRRLQQQTADLDTALNASSASAATRRRLELMRRASRAHHEEIRALCAPLLQGHPAAAAETYRALGTAPALDEGLSTYHSNVHRDWCWGEQENHASALAIDQIRGGGAPPSRVLVLGAGAGRLAYDLHQLWHSESTFALDFNPLLSLISARMARGESLRFHEFPMAPRTLSDHGLERFLEAPVAARSGLQALLGDLRQPPFRDGSFDVVITPWLLDVLDEDPAPTLARINRLLAPGGHWINFGSVNFRHADPALCLGLEELCERAEAAGFAAPRTEEQELPYLCSPASRHHRHEQVVTLIAARDRLVAAPTAAEQVPAWLANTHASVPRLPGFALQALATKVHLVILEMIDGKRSIADMAAAMETARLMTRAEAEPEIRDFLARLFEEAQRKRFR